MWVFGLLLRLPGFDVWLCFVYLLGAWLIVWLWLIVLYLLVLLVLLIVFAVRPVCCCGRL